MKELLLLRHAKSNWDDPSLTDHERPLAPRGRRAAPAMAQRMMSEGIVPDLVLCSTARRTRETWALADGHFDAARIRPVVEYHEDLYLSSPRTMMHRARQSGGIAERVLIVAHNPGTHELACMLAGSGDDLLHDRMARKFPTGSLARLRLPIDRWEALAPGIGELVDFIRPKDLDRADELRL